MRSPDALLVYDPTRLVSLREALGLDHSGFRQLLGLTHDSLMRLESGASVPGLDVLITLLRLTGMPPAWFFGIGHASPTVFKGFQGEDRAGVLRRAMGVWSQLGASPVERSSAWFAAGCHRLERDLGLYPSESAAVTAVMEQLATEFAAGGAQPVLSVGSP